MLLFVTSKLYSGDLGGSAGADAECQTLAAAAGLAGEFKAWLWTDKDRPEETFYHSPGRYMRTDMVVVANNFDQLFNGPLLATLTVTETKEDTQSLGPKDDYHNWIHIWTGWNPAFRGGLTFGHCDNWTDASKDHGGGATQFNSPILGTAYENGYIGMFVCHYYSFPILCVQQAWYPVDTEPG